MERCSGVFAREKGFKSEGKGREKVMDVFFLNRTSKYGLID